MEQALAKRENGEIQEFNAETALARIDTRLSFIHGLRGKLKEGEDFAKRPGYPKPALEKPGAEKIAAALNASPMIESVEQEIWDEQYRLKEYTVVLKLVDRATGGVWGHGVGTHAASKSDLNTKN